MSKLVTGSTVTINRVVTDSAKITLVRIEGYTNGFMWSVKVNDEWVSDFIHYDTALIAIHAACKRF